MAAEKKLPIDGDGGGVDFIFQLIRSHDLEFFGITQDHHRALPTDDVEVAIGRDR